MPLYEYQCGKCKTTSELLRERSQRDETCECPACGSARMRRIMSTFAGHVSGGGSSSSVAGSGGCAGCHSSSCAGCHR